MSMENIKFGTREIVAMVTGVALFAAARLLENYIFSKGILPESLAGWSGLGLLIIAASAVFFGPVCGMLCGIGGDLIIRALFGSSVRFLELFTLGLYGLLIGIFYGRLQGNRYRLGIREFVDFNVIQILVGITCGIFIVPLGLFMIDGSDLSESIVYGTQRTLGVSVMVGVILPVIMFIVSRKSSGRKDRDA